MLGIRDILVQIRIRGIVLVTVEGRKSEKLTYNLLKFVVRHSWRRRSWSLRNLEINALSSLHRLLKNRLHIHTLTSQFSKTLCKDDNALFSRILNDAVRIASLFYSSENLAWKITCFATRRGRGGGSAPCGIDKNRKYKHGLSSNSSLVVGVWDEPFLAKPAQLSSHTGPPGYIGWIRFQAYVAWRACTATPLSGVSWI